MKKRRLTDYTAFMASYLRAHLRPGMTQLQRNTLMRDGAAAWRRAMRGQNPFPTEGLAEDAHQVAETSLVACPGCGGGLPVTEAMLGELIVCGGCGATLQAEGDC